jgi:hypothetical protein
MAASSSDEALHPLKLTLRSIGGFSGPAGAQTHTLDLDALPAPERAHAQALVDAARLFDQPAKLLLAAPKPWDFRYLLDVQDGARSQHIELHLDAADRPLRALVQWLQER